MGAKQVEFQGEENGHTHKAYEQVQSSPRVVVLVHPCGKHCTYYIRVRVLQQPTSVAMVGCHISLRNRHFLHSPYRHHHCHY